MGLLSWLTSKNSKQEDTTPFPSDHVIVGKIARLIQYQLCEEEGGLAELLKPTCALVLNIKGNVSLCWLSSNESLHDAMSFALLNRLPAFNSFVQALSAFSKVDNRQALTKDWLRLMGAEEVDAIAAEALHEMKSNVERAERSRGKS
ncbi:MAG: hypothetical protein IPP12_22110 [Nitrospira sp.]|nr:hypothetical protein [Nitrospira sp.]